MSEPLFDSEAARRQDRRAWALSAGLDADEFEATVVDALARLSQFESALPGSPGDVQKGERT